MCATLLQFYVFLKWNLPAKNMWIKSITISHFSIMKTSIFTVCANLLQFLSLLKWILRESNKCKKSLIIPHFGVRKTSIITVCANFFAVLLSSKAEIKRKRYGTSLGAKETKRLKKLERWRN